jgi:hypothetical protein
LAAILAFVDCMSEVALQATEGSDDVLYLDKLVSPHPSFGAPIMARDERAAAAISVSAPESRLTKSKRDELIEQLLDACAQIAERVGHL